MILELGSGMQVHPAPAHALSSRGGGYKTPGWRAESHMCAGSVLSVCLVRTPLTGICSSAAAAPPHLAENQARRGVRLHLPSELSPAAALPLLLREQRRARRAAPQTPAAARRRSAGVSAGGSSRGTHQACNRLDLAYSSTGASVCVLCLCVYCSHDSPEERQSGCCQSNESKFSVKL
jgi:hypothetical protein